MACPNCAHSMQAISGPYIVFWCPRCGTIKDGDDVSTPMLVSRMIEFRETLDDNEPEDCETIVTLHRLGIHESITLPGQ